MKVISSLSILIRRLAASTRRHPVIGTLLILVSMMSVWMTGRLTLYMWSAEHAEHSLIPEDAFLTQHSCLSAYAAGASLFGSRDANLYEASHYHPDRKVPGVDLGGLEQDPYQYPPVLLVPFHALVKLTGNFASLRWWWYLIESTILLASLAAVAAWLGGQRAYLASVLSLPLVWGALPNLLALQFGNVQAVVIAFSILGMLAFEKKRTSLGGALLAFAILAKIFPGILVVYLLARRQWKEIGATAVWGIAFCMMVVVFGGPAPWIGFITYQLPRLASGEAFADLFVQMPISALINLSYSSLPYKLQAMGWVDSAPHVSRSAAFLGNSMVVVAACLLGYVDRLRRGGDRAGADLGYDRALLVIGWLSLVNLSTLQATMSPRYAVVGTLWLLTLWAAAQPEAKVAQTAILTSVAVLLLLIAIPDPGLILVSQLANIGINLAVTVDRTKTLWRTQERSKKVLPEGSVIA